MKFIGLGVGKRAGNAVKGWVRSGLIARFGFGGLEALVRLDAMTLDGFLTQRSVFGGIGVCQARSAGAVAGFDGGKPGGFDREAVNCMKVANEGTNTGQVVGIESGGGRGPLG